MQSVKLHNLIETTSGAHSWWLNRDLFKEVSQLFGIFLHTQVKLFTSTQNTKIKNMAGVPSPHLSDLFLHSITFLTAYWKPKHFFFEHLRSLIDILFVLLPII